MNDYAQVLFKYNGPFSYCMLLPLHRPIIAGPYFSPTPAEYCRAATGEEPWTPGRQQKHMTAHCALPWLKSVVVPLQFSRPKNSGPLERSPFCPAWPESCLHQLRWWGHPTPSVSVCYKQEETEERSGQSHRHTDLHSAMGYTFILGPGITLLPLLILEHPFI